MLARILVSALCILPAAVSFSQTWELEISSTVEIRTLRLSNKVEKEERPLGGAMVALYQGNTIVKQVTTDGSGDFSMMVPANGDYMIVVSYKDNNPKRFQVSTKGVPDTYNTDNWDPTFPIGGVIMAKPLYSIDYSFLKQPMAKIGWKPRPKVFDDDEDYTDYVLGELQKIKTAEDILIEKFVNANREGDAALKIPDCPKAKAMYELALKIIPGEWYPTEQLKKVGDCLKAKEAEEKAKAEKAAAEKAAKEAAEKAKKDKEEAERIAKEKAAAEKAAAEKAAKEQELAAKAAEEKAKKDKEEAERVAKEKAAADKAAAEKAAKDQELAAKSAADKAKKEKEEAERIAKEKAAAEKAAAEQKEIAAKEAGEKAKKEKELAEQAAKEKAEKEKAEAERIAKENAAKEKQAAELASKEKEAAEKAQREKALAEKAAKEKAAAGENAQKEAEKKAKLEEERLAREKSEQQQKEAERVARAAAEKEAKDKAAKNSAETEAAAARKKADEAEARRKAAAARQAEQKEESARKPKKADESIIVQDRGTTTRKNRKGVLKSKESKYVVPQVLGVDKYKETVSRADALFAQQDYRQAKEVYEEALRLKPNDAHAVSRIDEIDKLLSPK